MADIKFVDGIIVKPPRPGAPEYIKCKMSFHRAELREWLGESTDEWINVDVKESRSGKWYAAVNPWKPRTPTSEPPRPPIPARAPINGCPQPDHGDFVDDDIPF